MVMEELQELLQIIFYLKIVQIQNLSYTQFQLQLKRVAFCDIFYHIGQNCTLGLNTTKKFKNSLIYV